MSVTVPPCDAGRVRRIEHSVRLLAEEIGPRSLAHPGALARTASYLEEELAGTGLEVRRLPLGDHGDEAPVLEALLPGTDSALGCIVLGAHYDTVPATPGADDNASGVAALLELARALAPRRDLKRTIRFVSFPFEEPPFFCTGQMGSLLFARRLVEEEGVRVEGMISLESIGYFPDREAPIFATLVGALGVEVPSDPKYLVLAGEPPSDLLRRRAAEAFAAAGRLPLLSATTPPGVPGVMDSDHWAFQQLGVPAVIVTDAPPYRNPNYHAATDVPDTLDFERLGRAVDALEATAAHLAQEEAGFRTAEA